MNRLTGYRAAAELVKRILVTLHHDQMQGLDDIPFPPPRGYVPVRLCALSGMEATSACERVFLEWLRPGSAPVDECNVHVRLAVDSRTGQRATLETPRPFVELRTFTDLPPRYASWAAAVGLTRPPDAAGALPGQWARGPDPVRVSVTSPSSDLRLLRDPEAPPGTSTLALRAIVRPPVPQVVWYIDGEPHQIVDYPYETRWKLVPGAHVFQVRLPHEPSRSSPVRVVVE
jgi:penicillin-binding protein 1C